MRYLTCIRNTFPGLPGLILCVLAAALGSCEGPKGPRPDIVLITVDTLRADHMSLYGYDRETTPQIDAWFAGGTVYDRAYSTTSYTPASIVSLLTGLWPHNHHVREFGQRLDRDLMTLPRALSKAGYETCAIVSNSVLSSDWMALDKHFRHFDDRVMERERYRDVYERTGARTTDAALAWLKSRRPSSKPFFLWVHYNDPHGPYTPPEPKVRDFEHAGMRPVEAHLIPDYQRHPNLVDGEEYIDLYDEEIAYLDQEAGRLLRGLESSPRFDEMLVFLTADHGESMLDHESWFQHGHNTYEELIHVPLAVRGPRFGPARVEMPVSNLDIAPTIYAALNMTPPRALDGDALTHSPDLRPIFSESYMGPSGGKWRASILGTGKWMIYQPRPPDRTIQRRYYDLADDPHEENPKTWDPETAPEGALALQGFWNADSTAIQEVGGNQVEETESPSQRVDDFEERLRALGYQ